MTKIEPRKSSCITEFTVQDVKNSCEELSNLTYEQAMKVCELLAYVSRGVNNELFNKLSAVQDSIDDLNYELDAVSDNLRIFKQKFN